MFTTPQEKPGFDKTKLARFYDATALLFKRQPTLPTSDCGCGIPGLEVSESTWAEWEEAVNTSTR